jgi:hypothetical protein
LGLAADDLRNTDIESKKIASSILVAYFNALRSEILSRSGFQTTLIPAVIAASSALIGVYSNITLGDTLSNDSYVILFAIPLSLPVIGLIWLEHHLSISTIGRFIELKLMPQLFSLAKPSETVKAVSPELLSDWKFPEWEAFSQAIIESQRRDSIDFLPYRAIFGFFPTAVLGYLAWCAFARGSFCQFSSFSVLVAFLLACSAFSVGYFLFASRRVTRMIGETKSIVRGA